MSKHILITGASSGVGQALAVKLSEMNFNLSLCGRNKTKLDVTISKLAANKNIFSDDFCLSDEKSMAEFIEQAVKNNGDIDTLINCAGLNSSRAPAGEPDWQALDWMMQINYFAPIRLIEHVLPAMLVKKNGVILNVLSTTCLFSNAGTAQYSASKSALDSHTKVLRKELHGSGVKVLSLYPGGINTDFREQERPNYLQPEDVVEGILSMLFTRSKAHVHELIIRPEFENNFS